MSAPRYRARMLFILVHIEYTMVVPTKGYYTPSHTHTIETHTRLHTYTHTQAHYTQISINIYPVTQRHKNRGGRWSIKGHIERATNPRPRATQRAFLLRPWTMADDSQHARLTRIHFKYDQCWLVFLLKTSVCLDILGARPFSLFGACHRQ